jgi:hypothetical protein
MHRTGDAQFRPTGMCRSPGMRSRVCHGPALRQAQLSAAPWTAARPMMVGRSPLPPNDDSGLTIRDMGAQHRALEPQSQRCPVGIWRAAERAKRSTMPGPAASPGARSPAASLVRSRCSDSRAILQPSRKPRRQAVHASGTTYPITPIIVVSPARSAMATACWELIWLKRAVTTVLIVRQEPIAVNTTASRASLWCPCPGICPDGPPFIPLHPLLG